MSAAGALFLGLDVGTSGVKALLVTPAGEAVASATTPLSLSTPRPGWAGQGPDRWWGACVASMRQGRARRGRLARGARRPAGRARGWGWPLRPNAVVGFSRRERRGYPPGATVGRGPN